MSFFQTLIKTTVQKLGFLKSPNFRAIQIVVIFTKPDQRIIQITNFDQESNVLSYSNILCEIRGQISYLVIRKSVLLKTVLIGILPRSGVFKNAIICTIPLTVFEKKMTDSNYSNLRRIQCLLSTIQLAMQVILLGSPRENSKLLSCLESNRLISMIKWLWRRQMHLKAAVIEGDD